MKFFIPFLVFFISPVIANACDSYVANGVKVSWANELPEVDGCLSSTKETGTTDAPQTAFVLDCPGNKYFITYQAGDFELYNPKTDQGFILKERCE